MNILVYLIPASLILAGIGLAGFFWALRGKQYDDPEGAGQRILTDDYDDMPKK